MPKKKKVAIILLGLNGCGKSSLILSLGKKCNLNTIPTFGFSITKFVWKRKFLISFYDVGGSKTIRDIWKTYYKEVYGVIYMIDSSQIEHIIESRGLLNDLLNDNNLRGKPFLLLVNKRDKANSIDALKVSNYLQLSNLATLTSTFLYIVDSCILPTKDHHPSQNNPIKSSHNTNHSNDDSSQSQNSNSLEGYIIEAPPIVSLPPSTGTQTASNTSLKTVLNKPNFKLSSYPDILNPFGNNIANVSKDKFKNVMLFTICDTNLTSITKSELSQIMENKTCINEQNCNLKRTSIAINNNKVLPINSENEFQPPLMEPFNQVHCIKSSKEIQYYKESLYHGLDWLFNTILVHYNELRRRIKDDTDVVL